MTKHPEFSDEFATQAISYTYPGAEAPAVKDISFSIKKGLFFGVVGGTGAGKTTLVDVILGLLNPSSGSLLVDRARLNPQSSHWKSFLGYVPQDVYLTDNTLRRNIAYGIPDEDINDQQVADAVSLSVLDDVVKELPDGLDTMIGERGIRLSGGQRQRIGIARALYHDPELLIMDEATSALDSTTEQSIIESIERMKRRKTIIVIAHRLSTVRRCDQLLFMKDGRLTDQGTFDEIRRRNAEFARMVELAEVTGGTIDVDAVAGDGDGEALGADAPV